MSLKGKNVLIIDDNEEMRMLVKDILGAAGLNVKEASNVSEGWDSICQSPPHLVISDIYMPPDSGFDLIEKMKTLGLKENIPVILLSGLNDMKTIHTALSLGISDFVIKPFSVKTLLNKMRKALQNEHFFQFVFPYEKRLKLQAKISAELAEIGETGARLKGPFKLKENEEIKISSPILEGMKTPLKVSPLPKMYLSSGVYLNDITFVGINERDAELIRKKVAVWRQD